MSARDEWNEWLRFHAADDATIVLMSAEPSLEFMEQEAQLHTDDKAGHAEEDVTPEL